MKTYSLCLVLLFAAIAKAAVPKRPDNSVNEVHHDFQEDIHLMENEATSSEAIFLRDYEYEIEKEKLLGNYDDPDDDYYEYYDKDGDDEDRDWASGDDYDDEDEELLDDYEEEDDITFDDDEDEELLDDYEEEDDITFDDEDEELLDDYEDDDDTTFDDEDEELLDDYEEEDEITFDDDKDDIMYKYHEEDYKETDNYIFSKEIEDVVFQPPLVQIQDHGLPDKEDETLTCEKLSPSSHNLLVSSVLFASGLASFALFTLAFIIYFCNRRRRDSTSAKKAQLPFVIQHGSSSSPLHSSIIKPGKYQPVATQENRSIQSIENDNSLLKQQAQLEEKLLP